MSFKNIQYNLMHYLSLVIEQVYFSIGHNNVFLLFLIDPIQDLEIFFPVQRYNKSMIEESNLKYR